MLILERLDFASHPSRDAFTFSCWLCPLPSPECGGGGLGNSSNELQLCISWGSECRDDGFAAL